MGPDFPIIILIDIAKFSILYEINENKFSSYQALKHKPISDQSINQSINQYSIDNYQGAVVTHLAATHTARTRSVAVARPPRQAIFLSTSVVEEV